MRVFLGGMVNLFFFSVCFSFMEVQRQTGNSISIINLALVPGTINSLLFQITS